MVRVRSRRFDAVERHALTSHSPIVSTGSVNLDRANRSAPEPPANQATNPQSPPPFRAPGSRSLLSVKSQDLTSFGCLWLPVFWLPGNQTERIAPLSALLGRDDLRVVRTESAEHLPIGRPLAGATVSRVSARRGRRTDSGFEVSWSASEAADSTP